MGKTRIASWSETDAARMCPMKHELAYAQRWVKPPRAGGALSRGILFHEVMEAHYTYLMECQQANHLPIPGAMYKLATEKLGIGLDERERTEDQILVEWIYEGYVEHWGIDPDWKILAVEHPAEFWLPTPSGGRSNFKLKMKIDLVVQDGHGRIWVVDHKSHANLPTEKMLELEDQFTLYTWGLRQLGKNIYGQIYNTARTQRNKDDSRTGQPLDTRFQRRLMYRTDAELRQCAVDAYTTLRTRYTNPAVRHPNAGQGGCNYRCDFLHPCLNARKIEDGDSHLPEMLRGEGFIQDFTRH